MKHIYGQPQVCSPGCCCLWTVPDGVKRVTFELWGAGGNGNGHCSCNRCHHYQGAGGGFYSVKPSVFREVGSILYVLLVFIVAALESVLDVRVAPHM